MKKIFVALILVFMLSFFTQAQVFTRVHSNLDGEMQPVMGWLDINHSGFPDVFLSGDKYLNSQHYVQSQVALKGKGDRFKLISSPFQALYRGDAAIADVDKDGDKDVVMTGLNKFNQAVMLLYRNDGNRRFTPVKVPFTPITDGSLGWGDYDHDGDLDLLVSGRQYDKRLSTIIYRNDAGIFTKTVIKVPGIFNGSANWGDFDHDKDLDILITGNNGTGPFSAVYRNDNGKYFKLTQAFAPLKNSDAVWADFDGDGDLDILMSGENVEGFPEVHLYSNEGTYFRDVPVGIRPLKSCKIDVADYDRDGDMDIVMTGESMERPYTLVYQNNGSFDFEKVVAGLPGLANGRAIWGDYDKDGDMDLLISGMTVCYNFVGDIYRNNLNPPKKEEETETSIFINAPLPNYDRGPFYYYVFSSCYCDPSGGKNQRYHMYVSNVHKEKREYDLNYEFNNILLKTVPNWGKADRGHRTSNGFETKKEAEASRIQVIKSYKATGFTIHYINW